MFALARGTKKRKKRKWQIGIVLLFVVEYYGTNLPTIRDLLIFNGQLVKTCNIFNGQLAKTALK